MWESSVQDKGTVNKQKTMKLFPFHHHYSYSILFLRNMKTPMMSPIQMKMAAKRPSVQTSASSVADSLSANFEFTSTTPTEFPATLDN